MNGKKITKTLFFSKTTKYLIGLVAFVVWMLFFDPNSLADQLARHKKLMSLTEDVSLLKKEEQQCNKNNRLLTGDLDELEILARTKHKMKRADEDVYIITSKDFGKKAKK